MTAAAPFPQLQLDRGRLIDSRGEFVGRAQECSVAFAHELIERSNAHDELIKAARAAIAYDEAIAACGNKPERMASFCTAEGESLDSLYAEWIAAARAGIAKVEG